MASRRDSEVWLKFRAVLKTAMDAKKLRGYELAKAVGVWPTNVSHWLNDGSIPSGPVLMKLARALDLDPSDLIPGSGKALRGQRGENASERLIGGRLVLAELHDLLRVLEERWERRGGSAVAVSGGDLVLPKERKRRSKGS